MNRWQPARQLAAFATAVGVVATGIGMLVAWMVGHWIVALPVGAVVAVAIGALTDPAARSLRRRLLRSQSPSTDRIVPEVLGG